MKELYPQKIKMKQKSKKKKKTEGWLMALLSFTNNTHFHHFKKANFLWTWVENA